MFLDMCLKCIKHRLAILYINHLRARFYITDIVLTGVTFNESILSLSNGGKLSFRFYKHRIRYYTKIGKHFKPHYGWIYGIQPTNVPEGIETLEKIKGMQVYLRDHFFLDISDNEIANILMNKYSEILLAVGGIE